MKYKLPSVLMSIVVILWIVALGFEGRVYNILMINAGVLSLITLALMIYINKKKSNDAKK